MPALQLFHASPIGDIDAFLPLSHFGSEKAARQRLKTFGDGFLYSVELQVERELLIPDLAQHDQRSSVHSWLRLADLLHYDVEPQILTAQQRSDIFSVARVNHADGMHDHACATADARATAALTQALAAHCNVLAYENEFEDGGSMSYIALRPQDVRILSVLEIGLSPSPSRPRP